MFTEEERDTAGLENIICALMVLLFDVYNEPHSYRAIQKISTMSCGPRVIGLHALTVIGTTGHYCTALA